MSKIQGGHEGGSKNETAHPSAGRLSRKPDQWAVLTQVVLDLLALCEGLLQQGPSPARIDLRMMRWRLYEAFPRLKPTDSDREQAMADEEGRDVDG